MIRVNDVFDKVYVINLKKRGDRLIEVSQKLHRLGISFERIEAVNGYSEENLKEYNKYVERGFDHPKAHELEKKYKRKIIIGPGAIGILKSYKNTFLKAKENGEKRILVLEDDVIFIKNFIEKFDEFYKKIQNKDWKVFALGATQHVWNFNSCLNYPSQKPEYSPDEDYYYPKVTDGAFAVGFDEEVYDSILAEINKMNAPFDSGPLRNIFKEYHEKCFVPQPNLAIADLNTSNIGKSRDQFELADKLKWDMKLYDYPFQHDLVSVFMPTYNAESTLEKSVMSLLNQTYANIEIIIQDDMSTDNTNKVGLDLSSKYHNVYYFRNNENVGCYKTRNNAIRRSKGVYLAIQDPDDISLSDRIEEQVLSLIRTNSLISIGNIIRSKCEIDELGIEREEEMIRLVHSKRELNKNGHYDWLDREILGFNTSMFCRSVFINHGLFWEERFSADAEILERVLFEKRGLHFPIDKMNIHSYLMNNSEVSGIYVKLEKLIVISPKMGPENLTNKYTGQIRVDYENNWRKKFRGEFHYEYPRFDFNQIVLNHSTESKVEVSNEQKEYSLNKQIDFLELKLEKKSNDIEKLEMDKNWYADTYDHLPKWFLKIGSIFRRI